MTQDEFLTALKVSHVKDPFTFKNNEIRQLKSGSCPLCAVVSDTSGQFIHNTRYYIAALKLNMNHALRDKIVHAADYTCTNLSDIKMRQILLETLNLMEPEGDDDTKGRNA